MSFDRGRHAAAVDRPAPHNPRREQLKALCAAIRTHPKLAGGLVERRGVCWVEVTW
ncbi:hypothetical protein GCM10010191_44220 [Actinomadura vinacea]|uniref:Uncharacterized protein n=1 Tax=Actinomadura vinacea TaxID=115336 RepID=A0ABN3JCF1_9ACTN